MEYVIACYTKLIDPFYFESIPNSVEQSFEIGVTKKNNNEDMNFNHFFKWVKKLALFSSCRREF